MSARPATGRRQRRARTRRKEQSSRSHFWTAQVPGQRHKMVKHELEKSTLDDSAPPSKRVRFGNNEQDDSTSKSDNDLNLLADQVSNGSSSRQTVAWSRHNLLARAIPASPLSPARISFSLVPREAQHHKDRSAPFSLPLELAPEEHAQWLDFSPAGSHLLVVISGPQRLRIVLYQIAESGCINDWHMAHEWNLQVQQEFPPALTSLLWLSQDREVLSQTS